MYYGYYANMVSTEMFLDSAQRIESIISLVKPLGFVVPGKTSARNKVKIRHGGTEGTPIPKYTRFSGYNADGVPYSFYNKDKYWLNFDGEAIVEIIEGKSLIKEIPLIVNQENQKAFLHGLDIDISTISVEVKNPIADEQDAWESWDKADNIEYGLDEFSKVYWLERSELGFFIVFGGNVGSHSVAQFGQQISENDLVRVSYLKSSGDGGNGVGSIKINNILPDAEIETISLSSGGSNEPNLDMIRFFAPKWFAAQDRAVTVEDCRSLLATHGFMGESSDPYSVFNVWGGEDMNPPMYGRVFVSVNEENATDLIIVSETATRLLKDKTCVTILPEFINPQFFEVIIHGMVGWNPMKTNSHKEELISKINEAIDNKFPRRYENKFTVSEISNTINSVDSAIASDSNSFTLSVRGKILLGPDLKSISLNFGTRLKPNAINSSEFEVGPKYSGDPDIPIGQKIQIRASGVMDKYGKQKLEGFYRLSNNTVSVLPGAGSLLPHDGIVEISAGVALEPFDVTVIPKLAQFEANQHRVSKPILNISLVTE